MDRNKDGYPNPEVLAILLTIILGYIRYRLNVSSITKVRFGAQKQI